MCKLNYYLSLQDYTSLTFVLFVLKILQTLIDFTECFCTETLQLASCQNV